MRVCLCRAAPPGATSSQNDAADARGMRARTPEHWCGDVGGEGTGGSGAAALCSAAHAAAASCHISRHHAPGGPCVPADTARP